VRLGFEELKPDRDRYKDEEPIEHTLLVKKIALFSRLAQLSEGGAWEAGCSPDEQQ
jgi:hypothetical protein